jgi:transcriptional regulator with XRE-family HTH domain
MAPSANHGIDGDTVYRLRKQRGWSQVELARELRAAARELGIAETGIDGTRVSKWETGQSGISNLHARLLQYVFSRSMETDDHEFVHDVNRRAFLLGTTAAVTLTAANALGAEPWQRLMATVGGGHPLDDAAVDGLEAMNHSLALMFQPVAPAHLVGPVRAHLDTLASLLEDRSLTPALRRRITSLASEISILLGWVSKEAGDDATAQQCFTSALTAAVEADDHDLGSYAVASASTLPAFRASPEQSLGLLASTEVRGSRLDRARTSTKVWNAVLRAEVHTRTGADGPAFQALDEADRLVELVDLADDRRPVLGHFDADSLMGERGITAVRLDHPHEAEAAIEQALANAAAYPKTQSRLLTNAAKAHLRLGRVEQASAAAIRSLQVARQTGSGVGVEDVRRLRPSFEPYKRTEAVRQLDEALAAPA